MDSETAPKLCPACGTCELRALVRVGYAVKRIIGYACASCKAEFSTDMVRLTAVSSSPPLRTT